MKRNSWGIAGLAICVAAAMGAATVPDGALRIKTFAPAGVGILDNPNADGMAKLSFYTDPIDGPSIRAHVHLYDFRPGVAYGLDINTDQGGADFADIVTTNASGNGNVVVHFPVAAAPVAAVVVIYRDTINNDSHDIGEDRAVGVPD